MRRTRLMTTGRTWMRRLVDAFRARRGGAGEGPAAAGEGPNEASGGLLGLLDHIRGIFVDMGATPLEPVERQRLGGMIFAGSDLYVRGVAEGMQERPELFDVPGVSGADLARRQKRARCWFFVRAALLRMAQDAGDSYLLEQGQAIEQANRVIDVVRNEIEARRLRRGEDEGADERGAEQVGALHAALYVLNKRAEAKQRSRRRGARQVAEARKPAAQRRKEAQEKLNREAYEGFKERHARRVRRGLIDP